MDKQGSGSGSRRGKSVPNVSVPTTQTSPTPPPVGYRPQMMRPIGVEGWGFPQDWAYAHLLAQHTWPTVPQPSGEQHVNPSPPGVWDIRDDNINLDDDDIDDTVPETQPMPSPPPPPPQEPSQTKRKYKRKGKAPATDTSENPSTGKAPCKLWSLDEEIALARSWVTISEDSTIGNYRNKDNFWGAIKADFDKRMNYDFNVRSGDAIPTKAKMLLSTVAKFACVYNNPSNYRRSGETDIDLLNRAKDRFHSEYHKAFTHEHAWRQVKDCPKFDYVRMQDPKNIRAPTYKRSKTSETPTDSPGESDARTHHVNVGNDDIPSPTERPRPMGRNAARRAGSSNTAASSESVSNIANSLEAIATNVGSIMGSINNRQRTVDLKTFMEPHEHLTGIQLQIMLQEKEIIAERYGWQKYCCFNFNGSGKADVAADVAAEMGGMVGMAKDGLRPSLMATGTTSVPPPYRRLHHRGWGETDNQKKNEITLKRLTTIQIGNPRRATAASLRPNRTLRQNRRRRRRRSLQSHRRRRFNSVHQKTPPINHPHIPQLLHSFPLRLRPPERLQLLPPPPLRLRLRSRQRTRPRQQRQLHVHRNINEIGHR
ncbi:hypothetical protein OSB04_007326 [Centaurea solstitialis]|uniref:No apical meristem-associated C-terminal domain-containing protein n=1 Tax=Centaurea solstitialis TaxID=347529 RepID=A0AA38TV68_9ASTR|nr:hypothetical protein OSB04_007326 [Centaurea solstitialis]